MSEVGVFLGGQGKNELGGWCDQPPYRDEGSPGVIEALLKRVRAEGWKVKGACKWCRIRKYRAKGPSPEEEQNVLGLFQDAKDIGADIVAFIRDADDDPKRPQVIDAAVARAQELFPKVRSIGRAAIPTLEGWILALMGEHGTEDLGKVAAQKQLVAKGLDSKNTAAMVEVVKRSEPRALPADAQGLRDWLSQAAAVLPPAVTG